MSVVLASGAGCGKTHVLTERYLSHLRTDYADVGQLVAITFTDRAARQMRDRIRKAVLQELHAAVNESDAERWSQHLRALETAQISTFHAFCGALLRTHAVEVGLDPAFDVLEDVLAANLEGEALSECLQGLLTAQGDAGPDLRELVLLYGWPPVVEAVRALTRAWDPAAWAAWLAEPVEAVAERWQTVERARLQADGVAHLLATSPSVATCLRVLRTTPCIGPLMQANVAVVLEGTPRLSESVDLAADLHRLTEAAKVGKERGKAWQNADAYERVREAMTDYRDELRDKLKAFLVEPGDLVGAIEVGRRFLRVAESAVRTYRARKRRASAVDFQDLLVLTRDLLRDRPEIRYQLESRYQYLLIDELQDTDPVQMELIQSLCGVGVTEGKLFAVGDHSQSIYRFRGANVQLFQELRQQMHAAGRLDLSVNFRSQPAVLDFANALLGPRLVDYRPLEAFHPQVNPGPCVEFLWSACADRDTAAEQRLAEAEGIARRIATLIGEPLVREGDRITGETRLRPVRCGDVVLLFRAMSNVGLYENALRKHGLDYYLVGGRAFFAQQEIYDLLNLLRCLENPQDAVCLAGTLRSPFCCLSDEALFLLGGNREGLWAGLHDDAIFDRLPTDQRPTAARARRCLDRWRGRKDRLPIAQLLGEVFAESGYDAATQFEFLGDRKLANLWKLLELARTFDRSGLFGLAEFIQRLNDLVKTQPREEQAATQPENADVVRLMTIHQAKGLEFPVVFVPDIGAAPGGVHLPSAVWHPTLGCVARPPADEDPLPFSEFGWKLYQTGEAVGDWHEELRTLYVACTRPMDYLVLSASRPEPFEPKNTWMLTLAERFDLETGAFLDETVPPERRPQIRVTRSEELPAGPPPTERPLVLANDLDANAVGPVSAVLRSGDVVLLAGLEAFWRDPSVPPTPDRLTPSHDAEDGADRAQWWTLRQRLEPLRANVSQRERLLRAVLAVWDLRIADGWRSALAQAAQTVGVPDALQRECARELERLARSEVVGRLAGATVYHTALPFLLTWPLGSWPLDGGRKPKSRSRRTAPGLFAADSLHLVGLLDAWWQDADGGDHLLHLETGEAAPAESQRLGLAVRGWVMQQQTGRWPKSVTVYGLENGAVRTVSGQRFGFSQALVEVEASLTALLRVGGSSVE